MFGRSKLYVRLIVMSLVTTEVLIKTNESISFSFSVDFGSYLDQSCATFGGCTLHANYGERGPNTSSTRPLWSVGPVLGIYVARRGWDPGYMYVDLGPFSPGPIMI
ncbi:hypothetical protein GBA52_008838 [Prunus armeniaca]|nr:hypothetical protein GBA52_008838 [Prunus armeniaca]